MAYKFLQLADFCNQPYPPHAEIAGLLRDAATCMDAGNLGSACLRLADAGLLLRQRMLAKGFSNAAGLDEPTGRGAVLPLLPIGIQSTNRS